MTAAGVTPSRAPDQLLSGPRPGPSPRTKVLNCAHTAAWTRIQDLESTPEPRGTRDATGLAPFLPPGPRRRDREERKIDPVRHGTHRGSTPWRSWLRALVRWPSGFSRRPRPTRSLRSRASRMADAYELVYLPSFVQDLQRLVAEAKRAPQGPEDRTLRVTMAALQDPGVAANAAPIGSATCRRTPTCRTARPPTLGSTRAASPTTPHHLLDVVRCASGLATSERRPLPASGSATCCSTASTHHHDQARASLTTAPAYRSITFSKTLDETGTAPQVHPPAHAAHERAGGALQPHDEGRVGSTSAPTTVTTNAPPRGRGRAQDVSRKRRQRSRPVADSAACVVRRPISSRPTGRWSARR
jgi:hypothetical protein